ncbi:MAG: serine/threonine protein kinase [Labilithrix sp.]|nr:serine/threonine protein kinase [Labilithrix sp.]
MVGEEGPLQIGRYVVHDEIASGGMAKVHLGVVSGALGFSKIVAIKRILPHLLGEQEFVEMFVDETRLAARIQHPNVVSTLDAVVTDREVFLVMEFVLGESLARLLRVARKKNELVPPAVAVSFACGALRGLHAAHEAKNDFGDSLGVVHRDVSPQNVLVGADGAARVIDFGVAKARGRLQTTRDGKIKGKLAYMSPEQLTGHEPDRRTDVYATAVILWEALAGRRLHSGDNDAIVYANVLHSKVSPPSAYSPQVPPALDAVVMRALERDVRLRFATAEEMVVALEAAINPASPTAVGEWVRNLAGDVIGARAARIGEIERGVYSSTVQRNLVVNESGSLPQLPSTGSHSSSHSSPSSPSSPSASRSGSGPHSVPTGADVSGGFGRSMAHDVRPPHSSRIMTATVVLAIAAVLMASAIVVVFVKPGMLHRASAAEAPATTAPVTPAAPAPPAPPPAGDLPSRPTIAAAATAPTPPPSSTGDASKSATTDASAHATKPVAPTKPQVTIAAAGAAPVAKPAAKACDPPWFLDAKGIKRFKPECM